MENEIIGRLYYNRNKSVSDHNNFSIPHSTKNKNIFSPIKENLNENEFLKNARNNFVDNVTTTQGSYSKKNSGGVNLSQYPNQKFELNDFNAFLEKLSKYENKKSLKK
jgi:hypothetical protein